METAEQHSTAAGGIAGTARVTLFAGHYGSGKTNVALSYARMLRRAGDEVAVADLDIVNPYFRTKDAAADLEREGIELVVSDYANSNVDFPAMPREAYSLVAPPQDGERGVRVVIDVGGDDRGALALGRYVDDIRAGGDYEMLAVVNASRPLTQTPHDAVEVLREIEVACALPFTGIVNNTNLGLETTPADVLASLPYADEVSRMMGLPVRFTCAGRKLAESLVGRVENLFAVDIQHLYYMDDSA